MARIRNDSQPRKSALCVRGILCRSRRARRLKDPPVGAGIGPGGTHPIVTSILAVAAFTLSLISSSLSVAAHVKTPPAKAEKVKPTPLSEFSLRCPLKFITGICTDGPHLIWVAGEDNGLYAGKIRYRGPVPMAADHSASDPPSDIISRRELRVKWYHFDKNNFPGLASNFITAIGVDGKGRLWAGTDRHGVCVYNGRHWKHYNIVNGPLGCHVYAIAYDRYADQVWIATENGLSIYQCGRATPEAARRSPAAGARVPRYPSHTWHYITSINGLPPNPDSMAFNRRGTAFVGTLCGGLAIGRPVMHFSGPPGAMFARRRLEFRWRVVRGPWHMPITATGRGLPSNLINCVLVSRRRQHIYVGTNLGLAMSSDGGESFHYIRGSDYAAKVMGLWHPPVGYHPPSKAFLNKLLPGDHISSLAQDTQGNIWIGTWRNGYAILNPRTGQMIKSEDEPALSKQDGYINRFCPLVLAAAGPAAQRPAAVGENERVVGTMLIGRYGFGVHCLSGRLEGPMPKSALAEVNPTRYGLPAIAKPPLSRVLRRAAAEAARLQGRNGYGPLALPLDWRTQGNWIDNYGRFADVCATMNGDGCDQAAGYHNSQFTYRSWVGPGWNPREYLRYWVQWVKSSQPRVLQDLLRGGRKESEWDDHGEAYPSVQSGHGVFCSMILPAGAYLVSTYCVNKDGHSGSNRYRDYLLTLCRTPIPTRGFLELARKHAVDSAVWRMCESPRDEAYSRVCNFWGGVYCRFAIRLKRRGCITLGIHRNFSFNTITCGVFINRIADGPAGAPLRRDTRASGLAGSLLALRSTNPMAYAASVPAIGLPLLRAVYWEPRVAKSHSGAAGRAAAEAARLLGLFGLADRIRPHRQMFQYYAWLMRTKTGAGYRWKWNQSDYDRFIEHASGAAWGRSAHGPRSTFEGVKK